MSSKQEKNSINFLMDLVLDQTPDPWSKGLCRVTCLPMMVRIENLAERNAWSELEKIDILHESLKGKAMWYVCSLPRAMKANYRAMLESLTDRFGQRTPLPLCA